MKILQVNNFFNYGSTGKITHDIHEGLLSRTHQSIVCYGRGRKVTGEHAIKICSEVYSKINNFRSRITGIMYGGFSHSTHRLIDIILREKPDVVHLQCLNCFFINIYEIVAWLKENRIKTVLTLHAEFMYTANCGYALDCEKWRTGCGMCPRLKKATRSWFRDGTRQSFLKMQNAFENFGQDLILVSVSPWLQNRACQSPILSNLRHEVVYNGIDTIVFSPKPSEHLRQKHNIGRRKVLLHVTAKFSRDKNHLKGGYYILELAKRMKDVLFLVAGKNESIGSLPSNVVLLGCITDQQLLAEYYSLADAIVLTSKKETFSMPCAECLCCGTPVFGFKAGAPELISLREYSKFVEQGDIDALETLLTQYLAGKPYSVQAVSKAAIATYSKEVMLDRYLEIYKQLCES